jgi:hypothetical protein
LVRFDYSNDQFCFASDEILPRHHNPGEFKTGTTRQDDAELQTDAGGFTEPYFILILRFS